MSQNLIIPSKDNRVVMTFAGINLTLNTDIGVKFGAETYTLSGDPTIVFVVSATELSLDLSATSEVGKIFVEVTYFDGSSVNGTDITSQELGNLGQIIVAIGTQLIIEDGTGVANANSYATDAELKAYANLRGKSVPATQPEREALLVLAMDYIESMRDSYKGEKTDYTQSLQWPRAGVTVDGYVIDYNSIPAEIKNAQIEAAILSNTVELFQTGLVNNVTREKVDVIEVNYSQNGKWGFVRTETVDALLAALLKHKNGVNAWAARA